MSAIAILDAGGQYCHLIARRIREFAVHSEVLPISTDPKDLKRFDGVIISGGPRSVLEAGAPRIDPGVLENGMPVLGICYGHQLMAHTLSQGSVMSRPGSKEYGPATLHLRTSDTLFQNVPATSRVWMSHGDSVVEPPNGFEILGSTEDCAIAAMGNPDRKLFGVQFHPEVVHTQHGHEILRNFVERVCDCDMSSWQPDAAPSIQRLLDSLRARVRPSQRVLFFISGGVDSAVAYRLCLEALGADRVHGVFVDNGLLREHEVDDVMRLFQESGFANIELKRSEDYFLAAVGKKVDPELKRHAIGEAFLDIENQVLKQFPRGEWLLGQGTIYPDTIESGGTRESALIKTHHNRVPALLERIANGEIIEPLVDYYKDEVRRIGRALGVLPGLIDKQPFPGPGLAVRCLCADQPLLRDPALDARVAEIAATFGYRGSALPIRAVGVQGDERSYAAVAVLEGEGAIDWTRVREASRAITNTVPKINRVALFIDGASRPDAWTGHEAFLTKHRLDRLRRADAVARRVIAGDASAARIWQCPIVQLPVGVNAEREVIVLRPIHSADGMTAEVVPLEQTTLDAITNDLLSVEAGFEAVLFDVTNKPPATIEWE